MVEGTAPGAVGATLLGLMSAEAMDFCSSEQAPALGEPRAPSPPAAVPLLSGTGADSEVGVECDGDADTIAAEATVDVV